MGPGVATGAYPAFVTPYRSNDTEFSSHSDTWAISSCMALVATLAEAMRAQIGSA